MATEEQQPDKVTLGLEQTDLLSSPELRREKALVGEVFKDLHDKSGFEWAPEAPVYPSPDSTVLFVGAQMNLWKPNLERIHDGTMPPSAGTQPCIRLQNKDYFFRPDHIRFSSYFRMHGAITTAAEFSALTDQAISFLERVGIERQRLCLKASSSEVPLIRSDVEVLVDSEADDFYQWQYGEAGLEGRGITLSARNASTRIPYDIGNVILVHKDGRPLVAEWGFGEETLLTARHSGEHPIQFADLPDSIRQAADGQPGYKYVDALMTSIQMAARGVFGQKRGARALGEYISGLAYLSHSVGRTRHQVIRDIAAYSEYTGMDSQAESKLLFLTEKQCGRISYLDCLMSELPTQLGSDEVIASLTAKGVSFEKIGIQPKVARQVIAALIGRANER